MQLTIHQLSQEAHTVESIRRVRFTTSKGQAEILPGHEDLFALILAPDVTYLAEGSDWKSCATPRGGFLSFEKDFLHLWVL